MTDTPWTVTADGVRLAVRLTPRAVRASIGEVTRAADGRAVLAVRVAAPPAEGAANKALVAYLAERLDLPKSAVAIRSGTTARFKIVHLSGDGDSIAAGLAGLVAP